MADAVLDFGEDPTVRTITFGENILLTSKRRDC